MFKKQPTVELEIITEDFKRWIKELNKNRIRIITYFFYFDSISSLCTLQ